MHTYIFTGIYTYARYQGSNTHETIFVNHNTKNKNHTYIHAYHDTYYIMLYKYINIKVSSRGSLLYIYK